MYTSALASTFEMVVLGSTAAAIALAAWVMRNTLPTARKAGRFSLLFHPLAQLLFVCALVFANQILCNAYILRAHGGDARFVTRFLGPGWFSLATGWPVVRFVAAHVGDGKWLAPTVLRVQAFLELPFTIFAYLTVARFLGQDVQRRLVRAPLLVLACVSFSITFSLVEMALRNPWTNDDLVLRAAAAVVTPFWVMLATRLEGAHDEERPSGVVGLFAFFAGAGAISYIVLACYDALLLYNLAHLPRYALGLVVATAIAACASWGAPRVDRILARAAGLRRRSESVDAIVSSLVIFTIVFFVPSLALRYWAMHPSAFLSGLLLLIGSSFSGVALASRRDPIAAVRLVVGATISVALASVAGFFAAFGTDFEVPELALARGALAFLAVLTIAFRLFEVCCATHEAKAQADEA